MLKKEKLENIFRIDDLIFSSTIYEYTKGDCFHRIVYSAHQANGALKNGTSVIKINSEIGNRNQDGTLGIVIGSFKSPPECAHIAPYLYYIEWEGSSIPVAIISTRVKAYEK